MEFDEHEEQEEEIEMHQMTTEGNYHQGLGNSTVRGNEGVLSPVASVAVAVGSARKSGGGGGVRYKECLKNHAVGIGGHAVDGCGEFMAAGDDGTLDALKCAVCNCHRNFHRKEIEGGGEGFHHPPHHHHHNHHPPSHHHHHQFSPFSFRSPHPSGYLHVTPQPRPLALPSTSRDDEDMSNPSSSGGGGGGGGGVGGSKKRFRTKFTQEQKDKMLAFAESVGWRIQKQDEAAVQQFCADTNVKRHVLKVWMHNNKHTLGKKP